MATKEIIIPDFQFSSEFYYPELYRSLIQYKRLNTPELTDESDEEPSIQLLRAFALVGHLNNVLLDITANETLLPTSRLLESVRNQLALMDFVVDQAAPAETDVILEFSKVFTIATLIVQKNNQFATLETDESPQIVFETDDSITIQPTNKPTGVFAFTAGKIKINNNTFDAGDKVTIEGVEFEQDVEFEVGANIAETTDNLAAAINASDDEDIYGKVGAVSDGVNTISLIPLDAEVESITVSETDGGTDNFTVQSGGFGLNNAGAAFTSGTLFNLFDYLPKHGDILYVGQQDVMFDAVEFEFGTPGSGMTLVPEFYDADLEDSAPDSVTNLGTNLELDLTEMLGEDNRKGTVVRVVLSSSGASETVLSVYEGGVNLARTSGLLGQSAVSVEASDYVVGTYWNAVDGEDDASNALTEDGKWAYTLPQSLTKNWQKGTVNGVEAYWLRFRVIDFAYTAAAKTGSSLNLAGLDTDNYNLKIGIDGFANTLIDVTGDLGVGGGYVLGDIVTAINAALTSVDASLSSVASNSGGQLKLTSPTSGQASEIRIVDPLAKDATAELMGLSESGNYPYTYNGVGGNPIADRVRIDTGKQYLSVTVVQGQTVADDPLTSSNGTANQEVSLTHRPLIEGTLIVEVDEGAGFQTWNKKSNLLNSSSASKDYTADISADDETTIKWGNGVNGKIPSVGVDNVRAIYRIGADVNGNVGAGTINVNKSGVSFVNRVFNPRQATGWTVKEGSTPEDLERLKIVGPASLRTRERAITPADIEFLATEYKTASGSKLVARAYAIEETYGVKTIELVVVGLAGVLLTEAQRTTLEDYFNGNKAEGIEGVLVSNHEVTVVNYTPKVIDVTATVTGGNEEEIKNAIKALLNPEATYSDGTTKRWAFADEVPLSVVGAEMFAVDPVSIKKVVFTLPAGDTTLTTRQLPFAGEVLITVV